MEYYFINKKNIDIKNNKVLIEGFQYNHLAKVLRKKTGDIIDITDGERNIYNCEIIKFTKDIIHCCILSNSYNLNEPELNIRLFISPLRNSSRFEFAIEKAVELGVNKICPVITEHTVSKILFSNAKLDRIKKIIITAVGQSQRCYLPEFDNCISVDEMIIMTKEKENKIVMYEHSENDSILNFKSDLKDIYLLIGPEGGFSENEIEKLKGNSWQSGSLGKRKLRAETAAIIALNELLRKKFN